jgi:hypothetical protein
MIKIEAATAEMITEFYGEPPTRTQKALAVIEDGVIVSIVGVYRHNGRAVLFSNSLPEVTGNMKKYAKTAVKCMKLLAPYMAKAREVKAFAEPSISKSDKFLEHFGFTNTGGRVWQQRH